MLPRTGNFRFTDLCLWNGSIALGHYDRPPVGKPLDAAHASHHEGVAVSIAIVVSRKTLLADIEPVALTIVEHGTMADTHPSVV